MDARHVVFDLNGTLLDPGALAEAWDGDAPESLGRAALGDALGMAWVDTLAGVFRPLPELLEAALRRHAEILGLDEGPVPDAVEHARHMPPFPDSADALRAVRDAGLKAVVVTNSARDPASGALEAAGLLELVDELHGVDEVGRYKPHPEAYSVAPDPVTSWFVAAHWWDVTGAARAGFRTAWVSRGDGPLMSSVPQPDVTASSVLEAVSAALSR